MAGYKDYVLEFKLGDGTTHKIPFRVPMGENGGYYTPEIEQKADNLIEIRFTPSEPGMPAVDPVAVELPVGQGSGGNAVQYVPQVLTPEQKAQARANIGAATVDDVIAALPVYNGEVESV